jgi:DNA-binding SARP family transcriptional activator
VEVTAPYGHDGRFATLVALIDHYSDNPIFDPNLGYMRPVRPLKFTKSEKAALMAFLKTLTDRAFLSDPRFANPFVNRKDRVDVATRAAVTAALPALPPAPRANARQTMLERLVLFDRNADHRLSREELPERMHGLVARGDKNADAHLDLEEIRSLMRAAASAQPRPVFRPRPPQPDPSDGLPGVIQDLKLTPQKHAVAVAIVNRRDLLRDTDFTNGKFHAEMRDVLDAGEYENFAAAAARVSERRVLVIN